MTLRRLANPDTGEICPQLTAEGRCNCSNGGGKDCALRPAPAPKPRAVYAPRRRGWYREAVVRSGKLAGSGPTIASPDPIPPPTPHDEGRLF